MAINGLVISDLPTGGDILSFAYYMAEVFSGSSFPDNTQWWGGSYPYQGGSGGWPYAGYAWNGVYGVVDEYGAYQSPVAIPASSPLCLIDIINTDNLAAEFEQAFRSPQVQHATLGDWVVPWVQDKLILGLMARWKALYLVNGYDHIWSILQNLCFLAYQPLSPIQIKISYPSSSTYPATSSSFVASGNWSARELCTVLNVNGNILDGVQASSLTTVGGAYSLLSLVQCLDNITSGSWAGPPAYSSSGNGPVRPLGFRDRLAAAAV